MKIWVDKDNCTGCEICIPICPYDAIEIIEEIAVLARKAFFMYTTSIDAFLSMKALDTLVWTKMDDEIDSLHVKIIDNIRSIMSNDCVNINAGTSLILATRYIERIADHACNIAEESTYVVTSKKEKIE